MDIKKWLLTFMTESPPPATITLALVDVSTETIHATGLFTVS